MAEAIEKEKAEVTRFNGDLSAPEGLPETAIAEALELLRDGRLFRYGEDRNSIPAAALLEEEFAAYIGTAYCAAVNSGGSAIYLALRAAGVKAGDKVMVNSFTLAPVPGAIHHAGAEAVLVDIDARLTIDVEDLARKAETSGARFLLLSYMRGHLPDMDEVMAVAERFDLTIIEDCAHAMGATWDGQMIGTFGKAGCFSTQSFKQINAGEGGLLVTDDPNLAAKTILLSGSYMLYAQHRARPSLDVFERHRLDMPNLSMRMTGLAAAILRPQLLELDVRNYRWRKIYNAVADQLASVQRIHLPVRPEKEGFAPTSLQFFVEDPDAEFMQGFTARAGKNGVHVKWFGADAPVGFTSRYVHWKYLEISNGTPKADGMLAGLCDIRLPVWLTDEDCLTIANVLKESIAVE